MLQPDGDQSDDPARGDPLLILGALGLAWRNGYRPLQRPIPILALRSEQAPMPVRAAAAQGAAAESALQAPTRMDRVHSKASRSRGAATPIPTHYRSGANPTVTDAEPRSGDAILIVTDAEPHSGDAILTVTDAEPRSGERR